MLPILPKITVDGYLKEAIPVFERWPETTDGENTDRFHRLEFFDMSSEKMCQHMHMEGTAKRNQIQNAMGKARREFKNVDGDDQTQTGVSDILGSLCHIRYTRTVGVPDLREALELTRHVVKFKPTSHSDDPRRSEKLSVISITRFRRTSRVEDVSI